jgi:ketosteroid isomerase-like protein
VSDAAAIRDLAERYFYALDARQYDVLASCFDEGAVMTINGGERTMTGRNAIVDCFRRLPFATSTHVISSQLVTLEGEGASAHTLALAFVVGAGDDGLVRTRGVEYRDLLVRTADGWKIRRRDHFARWQFDAVAVPPGVPGT